MCKRSFDFCSLVLCVKKKQKKTDCYHQVYSFVNKPVSDAEFSNRYLCIAKGAARSSYFCAQSKWLLGEEPVGQNKHPRLKVKHSKKQSKNQPRNFMAISRREAIYLAKL